MDHWAKVRFGIDIEWKFGIIDEDTKIPTHKLVVACCDCLGIKYDHALDARRKLGHAGNKRILISTMFYGRSPKTKKP